MLNSLYGKFGTSLIVNSKSPIIVDGVVHYTLNKEEIKEGLYIPVASFCTSYAREITIRTSQAITDYSLEKYGVDKYIYSDTDSIHSLLTEEELKEFCDIDDFELGAWACEGHFSKAKFIRQKCYIEMIDDKIKITCAGLPQNCYDYVTWENFKTGFTCGGKLTYTHVKRWNYTKGNRLHDKRREVKKKHSRFLKYRIV